MAPRYDFFVPAGMISAFFSPPASSPPVSCCSVSPRPQEFCGRKKTNLPHKPQGRTIFWLEKALYMEGVAGS
jgi:hypothetical protein